MSTAEPQTGGTGQTEFCPKHPDREARLRCNRCGRLMCTKCAVRTPTGYRCVDCVRGQQKVFDTAIPRDYILAPIAAGFLSLIGGAILSNLWIYFIILGAPFVGGIIAEATRRVTSKRRAKRLFQVVAAAVVLGGLVPALLPACLLFLSAGIAGAGAGETLMAVFSTLGAGLLWNLVYAILAGGATYYSLTGMKI